MERGYIAKQKRAEQQYQEKQKLGSVDSRRKEAVKKIKEERAKKTLRVMLQILRPYIENIFHDYKSLSRQFKGSL